jgi:uncharacterized protein with HEPN domain
MTRAYKDYLDDILEVSAKAQQFVAGVDFATFEANEEKIYAVIRALEVIGEAVKFIPQTERDRYPPNPLDGRCWNA